MPISVLFIGCLYLEIKLEYRNHKKVKKKHSVRVGFMFLEVCKKYKRIYITRFIALKNLTNCINHIN